MLIKSNFLIKEIIINLFVQSIIYLEKLEHLISHMMILCLLFLEPMVMSDSTPFPKFDLADFFILVIFKKQFKIISKKFIK